MGLPRHTDSCHVFLVGENDRVFTAYFVYLPLLSVRVEWAVSLRAQVNSTKY